MLSLILHLSRRGKENARQLSGIVQMRFELVKYQNKNGPVGALPMGVELQGIEPWSKHIRRKLSTCLFSY